MRKGGSDVERVSSVSVFECGCSYLKSCSLGYACEGHFNDELEVCVVTPLRCGKGMTAISI